MMREPLSSQLYRLKGMRTLYRFLLVTPAPVSLRLFEVLGRELDDMITEWETELQLKSLVLAKQAPSVDAAFDDGDHLVEDQMPDRQQGHSTGSMK